MNRLRFACVRPVVLCLACLALPCLASSRADAQSATPPAQRFDDPARLDKLAGAFPELDRLLAERMRQMNLPGVVAGVIVDGRLVHVKALGVRDVASNAPVDSDTVFRIASMTKSVTALAVLRLRDEGRLSLEDPVTKLVPELSGLAYPTLDSPPLTIRHLMTHSAGFPEDNPWGDRQLAQSEETFSAWMRGGIPFSTAPGTAYEYSNYGFAILGRVVSRASGVPYQQYIRTHILEPLGMTSTYWETEDVPADRRAGGYLRTSSGWTAEPVLGDGAFGAMGGLWTSTSDLAKYVAFHLSAWPPRDSPDPGPVRRASVREMQQAARASGFSVTRTAPDKPVSGVAGAYGYGLRIESDCQFGHMVGHGGGLPGFGSHMRWLPDYGVGLIVMANHRYAPASVITRAMLDVLAATGALRPRPVVPSPALLEARERVARLIDRWDDGLAKQIAADNLFLDEPLEERRRAVAALRDGLGACRVGAMDAENALRGTFRMDCERGWLDVSFTLAPTLPPGVQYLSVTRGTPLGEALGRTLGTLARAVADRSIALAPITADVLDTTRLRAALDAVMANYGACRLGAVREGDGATNALVRFECARGPLDVRVRADAASGRLSDAGYARAAGSACVP